MPQQSVFRLITGIFVTLCFAGPLFGDTYLFTISPFDANFRIFDPGNGTTDYCRPLLYPGKYVLGGNGLAAHPTTGELFSVLRLAGQSGRQLAKIDPDDGTITSVGNTGDNFANLTFAGDGTLYGVTGDGATVPATLYTLNTANASKSVVCDFDTESVCCGESIGFNTDDGLIYHASGDGNFGFEKVNPSGCATTGITYSGDSHEEVFGLLYTGSGNFYMTDRASGFFTVTNSGAVSLEHSTDHFIRGMAFDDASFTTAELSIVQTSDRGKRPYKNGETIVWTIVVSNNGSNTAHGVQVQGTLTSASFSPSPGSCTGSGSFFSCSVGNVVGFDTVTFTVTGTVTGVGKQRIFSQVRVGAEDFETGCFDNEQLISNKIVGPQ